MNVLAIDQGTSSTKALLVADGSEIVGESSAPVNPRSGAEGAVEQDPEELFQSIVTAGLVALGATYGGSLVFDYGFNVETAGDSPVWHTSEVDVLPGDHS